MDHLGAEITFGQWLRRRRKSLDLTQVELAEHIPCAKGTIRRLESDDLRPSKHLAERLADALSVPLVNHPNFVHFARQGLGNSSILDPAGAEIRNPRWDEASKQRVTPLSPPATRRYSLPAAANPILGRTHTIEVAMELLLRPDVRLVTLLGPPGVGKTRLALQIATQIQPHFRNGACFIALASLAEAGHVLPAIAQVIELLDSGRPLVSALADRLQSEELLLVLDNFEHLITAAPTIATLLAVAPTLKVLCTSRISLQIGGEHEFIVPLLALPDLAHLPPLAKLATNPAVALFVARARAVLPNFALTAENVRQIAEICHRLDGLPLAIELAATRIKLFAPSAILARLDQRLPFLTGSARDAPTRQRTLTAAIAWSYDLLDDVEKRSLNRLSVFWGGCTLEAAESIYGDDEDIVNTLAVLVNHSLVQAMHDEEGQVRFSLLETIREFALQRLNEQGESATIEARHANYFLSYAAAAKQGLQGAQQVEWMKRLNAENANLRAAFDWSLSTDGASEVGLEAGAGLWWFWWTNGQVGEGRHWLHELIQRAQVDGVTVTRAYGSALLGAAYLAFFAGESSIALSQFEEAQKLSAQLGDMLTYGSARFMIKAIQMHLTPRNAGDGVSPLDQLDQALAILRKAGAEALSELGVLSLARSLLSFEFGDLDGAQQNADAGMEIFRRLGQPYGIGLAFNYQGDVARLRGDHTLAAARYQAGLPLLRQANARSEIPAVLHNLAHSILAQGDVFHARKLFTEGLVLHVEVGNRMGMAECLIGLAAVAIAQNQARHAATLLSATDALLTTVNVPLYRTDQTIYQHIAERAREELELAQWEAAQMAGREMTLAELIASAQLSPSD